MNAKLYKTTTTAIPPTVASLAFPVGAGKKAAVRNNIRQVAKLVSIGMASFMLLSSGLQASPAYALPASPPLQSEKALECLGDLQGTLSATPQPIPLGQSGTLHWNVTVPSSCTGTGVKLYVDNQVVSATGNRTIQPIADTSAKLHATLPAVLGGGKRTTTSIKVDLPEPPAIISINANYMEPLLLQALREGNKYIRIENHVELDLSGREYIPIAGEVTLEGGRTPRQPGPQLFTTTRPRMLFLIEGDDVRITGVRIEGPDMGVANDDENAVGIFVRPTVAVNNIEIDHNELSGWSWAAVQVWDDSEKIDYVTNPEAVHIHDNFIHHNQRVGGNGYGVAVGHGAYALIERNVFDWNRHAISGEDGSEGSGYRAYRNLVLKNGGYHDTYNACDIPTWVVLLSPAAAAAKALCLVGVGPSYMHYTHQFDMHGTETCGLGHLDCGDAGHSMYIRHNTFLYTAGNAIKLRGIPEDGMYIGANVFAHDKWEDAVVATETIGAYVEPGNVLGVDASTDLGVCDFDGDGLNDSFMATGATWWFSSGGDRPWAYLNTSTRRLSQVTLGFFNADNICDVWVDGTIYPGGKPQKLPVNRVPLGGGVASTSLSR